MLLLLSYKLPRNCYELDCCFYYYYSYYYSYFLYDSNIYESHRRFVRGGGIFVLLLSVLLCFGDVCGMFLLQEWLMSWVKMFATT